MSHKTTLIDYLFLNMRLHPGRVLYRFMDEQEGQWTSQDITISQLYYKSLEIANMLRKKGLKPGDRAVIFSLQDFGTIYAVYGCMMAGVVFSILPPPLDESKVERFISVVNSCQPKALISNYAKEQEADLSLTSRLLKETGFNALKLRHIYTDRLMPYKRTDVVVPRKSEDLVYLQYTSGSTSAPKGVRVTWKNLLKNLEQCIDCYDFTGGRLSTWVPFFHNLGLVITVCMPTYLMEACVHFLPTTRFLENPKLWIRQMHELNLNLTVGPGSAYDACTRIFSSEEAAQYPLEQVTHFMNGSEFISARSVEAFTRLFHCQPNAMAPGYGLSENVCLATFATQDYRTLRLDYEAYQKNRAVLAEGDVPAKEIVSVGAPVKDLLVVIGNPKTKHVYPELKIGEIFISGDSVADGYWGGIRENANFHVKLQGYDCEFYKTGDLGFLYQGHLYITGRIKEMLIVNGHNIYPNDLQQLLIQKIPAMAGSTFGFFSCMGDNREQLVAAIEANPEDDFQKRVSQINGAVSERFGFSFHDIVFVPRRTLPRTDNGKLKLLDTRQQYQEGRLQILYSSQVYRTASDANGILDKSLDRAEELMDRADEVMIQVKAVFENILHIEQYSLTDSFLELGGDSLMGFELLNGIEEKFHVKLDLREILRDASVVGITRYLHQVLSGMAGNGKSVNLKEECVLDDSIQVTGTYQISPEECDQIFLTGATGFLGAQLIQAIIRQYPRKNLAIYCLVRSSSEESAMERLSRNMKHYQCWKEEFRSYLHPVLGDLSSPKLGLDESTWNFLAENIQVIYHNGALLNFVFPYEFLKTTNVHGTVETLRLAAAGNPKYYHFVSSYSVYDTPDNLGKKLAEEHPLETWKGFSLSYSETKWVSEKLIGIAKERGLKAAIYRPGDITGAANGIWEMDDMVSRIMVSMIQMKCIPHANYEFHMTPVDYVAKALICISRKKECVGHCFNLVNDHPVPLKYVVTALNKCGFKVHYVPFIIWRKRLKEADASSNALVLLECLFEDGNESNPNILRHFTGRKPVYETTNTRLLLNGSGIRCPKVDQKYLNAYLNYFKKAGYI